MKYVIFKRGDLKHVVLCADHTSHSSLMVEGAKPVSAGFVSITDKGVSCFGSSDSLNLSSKPEDDILVKAVLANCGIYAFLDL